MSELNSCPICGCSVRVWAKRFDEEDMEYIIECDNDFCGLTYGISCGYNRDEIEKAWNSITALSPKVNEDCISRADLIESFLADNECKREEAKACMCSLDLMLELIEDAPSVMPTKKTGEWIGREHCQVDEDAYDVAICSNCGAEITLDYSYDNYCPNCGAKMEGKDRRKQKLKDEYSEMEEVLGL